MVACSLLTGCMQVIDTDAGPYIQAEFEQAMKWGSMVISG